MNIVVGGLKCFDGVCYLLVVDSGGSSVAVSTSRYTTVWSSMVPAAGTGT
jgi:hypothetical protein